MAITLVTGRPGSGKSLYAVSQIEQALQEGRPVFSDIDGLAFDGVEPPSHDWREHPDGSFVVLDEVHQRWPSTGKGGRSANEIVRALDEHRHRGFDFLLLTQWPTKLDFEARTNCTEHIHLRRIAGSQSSTLYRWPDPQTSPDDRSVRDTADSQVWPFPKRLYPFYKSATIHTHKFRMPRKVIVLGLVALVTLGWAGIRVFSGDTLLQHTLLEADEKEERRTGEGQRSAPPAAPTIPPAYAWLESRTLPTSFGCIATERACMCYSSNGQPLDLTDAECRDAMERPIPPKLGGGPRSRREPS